jgi:hypothetical protein
VFALCLVPSDDVHACGNPVRLRTNERVGTVATAERQVAEGQPLLAAQRVLNEFPTIRETRLGVDLVSDRALRVMARAVVRTRATLDAGKRFAGASDAQRAANLKWAVYVLHAVASQNPKDSAASTDLGEALALVPERRDEARRLLSKLAAKDLVASAQGYAALASLYRDDGKDKPAFIQHPARTLAQARLALAEARCRRMAVDDEAVCGPAPKS